MRLRHRVMSALVLVGCLAGIVAIPLGVGAHEPLRFCPTAAECPDLRWPTTTALDTGLVVEAGTLP